MRSSCEYNIYTNITFIILSLAACYLSYNTSVSLGCIKNTCNPRPCIDALIMYHEDDLAMLVQQGALSAVRRHIVGVHKIFIVSASNRTLAPLLDRNTIWFDERSAPFTQGDWDGRKSTRPAGWLYQQTLKLWAVANVPGNCNNIFVTDADTMWMRDFDVFRGGDLKIKYNVASAASGAWEGDIVNPEYHHLVSTSRGCPRRWPSSTRRSITGN